VSFSIVLGNHCGEEQVNDSTMRNRSIRTGDSRVWRSSDYGARSL
jgi:hypothetical protein